MTKKKAKKKAKKKKAKTKRKRVTKTMAFRKIKIAVAINQKGDWCRERRLSRFGRTEDESLRCEQLEKRVAAYCCW